MGTLFFQGRVVLASYRIDTIFYLQTSLTGQIKCDRTSGGCLRCQRFGEICSFTGPIRVAGGISEQEAVDHLSQAGYKRRRVRRSCFECKRAKAKCTGEPFCKRCKDKMLDCVFGGHESPRYRNYMDLVDKPDQNQIQSQAENQNQTQIQLHMEMQIQNENHIQNPIPGSLQGSLQSSMHAQMQQQMHQMQMHSNLQGQGPNKAPNQVQNQNQNPLIPPVSQISQMSQIQAQMSQGLSQEPPERLQYPLKSSHMAVPGSGTGPSSYNRPMSENSEDNFLLSFNMTGSSTPRFSQSPSVENTVSSSRISTGMGSSSSQTSSHNSQINTQRTSISLSNYRQATNALLQQPQVPRDFPQWVMSRELPEPGIIWQLLETFFSCIHSTRCFGFIHRATFMKHIRSYVESRNPKNALIHVMCALATPFYLKLTGIMFHPHLRLYDVGNGWAAVAKELYFDNFNQTGIEKLMVGVLLQEYFLSRGDFPSALFISGIIARHLQVLQLNIEHDFDLLCEKKSENSISFAVKESRRRLTWACYLMDAYIECGVDELRFISAKDIQVQLPCDEDLFINEVPCITETLSGTVLPFLKEHHPEAKNNLDLRAYYIRAINLRSKILKYVKTLENETPWEIESKFQVLACEVYALEQSIPPKYAYTDENVVSPRTQKRLNLFFGLHIVVAQNYHDLYRIGVSNLVFPDSYTKKIRDSAPLEFLVNCYKVCAAKAVDISRMVRRLFEINSLAVVDLPYLQHIQVSSRVLSTCLTTWSSIGGDSPLLPEYSDMFYSELLASNVRVLDYIRTMVKGETYYESAEASLRNWQKYLLATSSDYKSPQIATVSKKVPPQFSLEYILNPLGTYPLARKEAQERHVPENYEDSNDDKSPDQSDMSELDRTSEAYAKRKDEEMLYYLMVTNPIREMVGDLAINEAIDGMIVPLNF